jgi:thiol-disulfide isomerase/thioredoxin
VEPDPVEPPAEPDPVEPPAEPDPVEPSVEPDPVEPPVEPDPVEPPEEEKPTSPPAQEDSPKPSITLAVPDFTVLDEDGNPVKLSDFAGKPIVLNFWATWCYYCKQEMPAFDRAYRQFPDVQFVMVNATDGIHETVNGVKTYVSENRFGFDVLFDINQEAIYAYGVTSFPQTFFIGADGKPVVYVSGMLDYETLLQGIEMITP